MGNAVIRRLLLASAVAFAGAGTLDVATFAPVDHRLYPDTSLIGVPGSIQGAGSDAVAPESTPA